MKKSLLFLSLVSYISLAAQQPPIELTLAQVGAIGHVVGEVVRTTIEYSLKGPGLLATLTAARIPLSFQQSAAIATGNLTLADICLNKSQLMLAKGILAGLAIGSGSAIGYQSGKFIGKFIPIPLAKTAMGIAGSVVGGLFVAYNIL